MKEQFIPCRLAAGIGQQLEVLQTRDWAQDYLGITPQELFPQVQAVGLYILTLHSCKLGGSLQDVPTNTQTLSTWNFSRSPFLPFIKLINPHFQHSLCSLEKQLS